MSQYNNQGYLFFKNGKFTGKITIDGVERRIEGWWKERNGRKDELVSLAVKTEEEHQEEKKKRPKQKDYDYEGPGELQQQNVQGGSIDEIPF